MRKEQGQCVVILRIIIIIIIDSLTSILNHCRFQISSNERLLAAGGQELLRGSLSFSPIQVFTRDARHVES
jgi:hypothetical protein